MPESLDSRSAQFEADVELAHQLIHGTAEQTVETDNGPLRTFAGALAEYDSQVAQSATAQSRAAAEAAASTAATAQAQAELARDAAQLSAGVYADTSAGLSATTTGEYFSVPAADAAESLILYKNNAGSALETKRYPSAELVQRLAGAGDFAPAYAVIDAQGRIALQINNDGTVVGQALQTAAGASVDEHEARLAELADTGDYPLAYALVDAQQRVALGVRDDGKVVVRDILAGTVSLLDTAQIAQQAAADASSGGASAFRATMLAAQAQWGQYPRAQMTTPPTLTLTQTAAPPADAALTTWSATGKWRTTGGFTSQYGANPYLQWKCRSPNGNAGGFTTAGGVSLETIHSGTRLYAKLRGAGGGVRVLVGDAQGRSLAYANKVAIAPAADGQQYELSIDFGGVSATRTIVIEGDAALQFGGFFVKTGESIAQPAGAKPLVCCMGTSITEANNSWARWIGYRLGADVYNTGVGSSGILVAGTSPKVKQMERSQDLTAANFVLGIDENGINDTGDGAYSAATYAAVTREFGDEYRRVLDAWFAAHPSAPFIAWGPFWPSDAPVANAYRIRDAKQRVCSEYPLAAFIDTLSPNNIIKGSVSAGTYPAKDYFAPYVAGVSDTTHPIETGQEFIGLTLFSHVDALIRTRF